ncbi:hypothetical protein IID21_02445 [Patescibacteria group bacterium]|nr:hypothetical protein [Patescibacteria group bacterium]
MAKIPKSLQPILWSRDINSLDLNKNRAYIINQVLAYGTMEHIKWLFQNYSQREIKKVFIKKPIKIYSPSAFNWINTVLLENKKPLDKTRYVENTPRNI